MLYNWLCIAMTLAKTKLVLHFQNEPSQTFFVFFVLSNFDKFLFYDLQQLLTRLNQFQNGRFNKMLDQKYWIILHFNDHQGGKMNRSDYESEINKFLNKNNLRPYPKTKKISKDFFELLEQHQQTAIQRAKRNHEQFQNHKPSEKESSTTVFKLVEEILKYV